MGFFDGLTDPSFKQQPDGSTAFYPGGVLGKGFVLPDRDFEERLRRKLKISYIVFFAPIFTALLAGDAFFPDTAILFPFVALPLYFLWFEFSVRRKIRDFPIAPTRLTLRDTADSQAKALSWWWLIPLAGICITFLAVGVWIIFVSPADWVVGSLAVAFSLLCLLSFANISRSKIAAWRGTRV